MKNYDTAFIKKYIEEHRDEIESVECGMKEDWNWTAETIYSCGNLSTVYDWESRSIEVSGIDGSVWATPVMEVSFKDGRTEIVDCFFDDEDVSQPSQIAEQKFFAFMTGGRPIM